MKEGKCSLSSVTSNLEVLGKVRSLAASLLTLMAFIAVPFPCHGEHRGLPSQDVPGPEEHPPELLELAESFRALRGYSSRRWEPGEEGGVPDFAAIAHKQKEELERLRSRLDELDTTDWSVHYKIDTLLLRAEMDKLEWELYVIRQWSRNPSFYVDRAIGNVKRHLVGGRVLGVDPTLMPYTKEQADAVLQALAETDQFLAQARRNLTEIVPELAEVAQRYPFAGWPLPGGDSGHMKNIVDNYRRWAEVTAEYFPDPEAAELVPAAIEAGKRLLEFGRWLEQNREKMTGGYAIGKELGEWFLHHAYLIPYDYEHLELLAEMERARALSYLQFEIHKNRHLPPIGPAETASEYLAWDNETVLLLRRWYLEKGQDLLTDQDYQPLIRSEEGVFLPPLGTMAFPQEEKPSVSRVLVVPADHWAARGSSYGWWTDPGVLQGHEYWPGHTYEGYVHRHNPCPIRRAHRNSSHSEGWCFYNEELLVGLDFPFVRGPRARELVYINMLQRAERILIGLPLLSGEMSPEEAYHAFLERVPALGSGLGIPAEEAYMEVYKRVIWRGNDCFDALSGKVQLLRLLADRKMQLKDSFRLKDFHDEILSYGRIPFSLLRWEILGDDTEAQQFFESVRLSTVLSKIPR
jgi:hypothetical protein